jgi:hypothetical protein
MNLKGDTKDGFRPGQIIFYAKAHLALLIKPENGEDIWLPGLFVNYLNASKESCIITDVKGLAIECPTYMIQKVY